MRRTDDEDELMPELMQQIYAERDGRFYPKMCAQCVFWLDDFERDEFGRKGFCSKLNGRTYRTDWCKLPEEVEKHKEAMRNYVAINYKGERVCKSAS